MKKKDFLPVLVIYIIAAIVIYPVLAQIIMYDLNFMVDKLPHSIFWVNVQVFLSAPLLIILGIVLYVKYDYKIMNKIFGVSFFLLGIYWLITILKTVAAEAA